MEFNNKRKGVKMGNQYYEAPPMCQMGGGALPFVCEYHAKMTGGGSVCLYRKNWKRMIYDFKCPNREWQKCKSL